MSKAEKKSRKDSRRKNRVARRKTAVAYLTGLIDGAPKTELARLLSEFKTLTARMPSRKAVQR